MATRQDTMPPEEAGPFPPTWLCQAHTRLHLLTERQRDVMRLLSLGMGNSQIAHELSCSERTVKQHISAIFVRLNIESRLQAGLVAYHDRAAPISSESSTL